MKLVGLISGGKDSVYNMLQCVAARHDIVALANIEPYTQGELDSYMYQSVGHEVITLIASALNLPVYRLKTKGKAFCQDKTYNPTENDEVEDLLNLLSLVMREKDIEGVSVGAIASDYQRTRVENVCSRLGLKCFAYLWKRDQIELLQEMIDAKMEAIIIKVASIGLNPKKHLGMTIKEIQPFLLELHKKYGMNVCGEGGEYETLTLNCPLYHRSISITSSENVFLSNDEFAPVGFLHVKEAALNEKSSEDENLFNFSQQGDNKNFILSIVKGPESYVDDCINETELDVKHLTEELPAVIDIDDQSKQNVSSRAGLTVNEHRESTYDQSTNSHFQSKSFLADDLATYEVNNSSGWCCIGNVIGRNLMEAMNTLKGHLKKLDLDFEDVVIIYIYVRDMTIFNDINAVYSQFVPKTNPPAFSCVEASLSSGVGVVLMAVAQKVTSESQKFITNPKRETLQVQSISHWVPAAIGPYSHCIKVGEIYYFAAQIPLIPGSMEILNKPVFCQCKLTLRHLMRILSAMNEKFTFLNIFQAICYVVSQDIAEYIQSLWTYLTKVDHTTVSVVVVKALPQNALLSWEVVACSTENPSVDKDSKIVDGMMVYVKRCMYKESSVCSLTCKVSYVNQSFSSEKHPPEFSVATLTNVLVLCIDFLKKDFKDTAPLCMIRMFYKSTLTSIPSLLCQSLESVRTEKVIVTPVPVVACENSNVIITMSGMCS